VILAGDIGGTNTRLALFNGDARPLRTETYPTAGPGLADIVGTFLSADSGKLDGACFGIAGTIAGNRAVGVNLPWDVDGRKLGAALGAPVAVVNDLHANARGIEALAPEDFAALNAGDDCAEGNRVVVSAGTGLGEAGLIWAGARYHAVATEGGHVDFAPRSELEVDLYRFLAAEHGHVSYERICSGAGLVNIYRFLSGVERDVPSAAEITAEALADRTSTASAALDLFVSIYGARAGNAALAYMATGGVFLGGGIPPKILERLREGGFMRAFVDKGRFTTLLSRIPVRVIVNDHAALLGAARIAAELPLSDQLR
jgi:glucokinase